MGKRYREVRTHLKKVSRHLNVRETELGELKYRMTKAEARALLASRELHRRQIEDALMAPAREEIGQEIDREVLRGLFGIGVCP